MTDDHPPRLLPAIADNCILALFVDSGRSWLLYQTIGILQEPPSILDPDPNNSLAEFNRYLHNLEADPDRVQKRLGFLDEIGRLWQPTMLTPAEANELVKLAGKHKNLRNRAGDLEVLVLAKNRGWLLLSDDRALRQAAQGEGIPGVRILGSCGILLLSVKMGILSCSQAAKIYQEFKERFSLRSKLVLQCDPPACK